MPKKQKFCGWEFGDLVQGIASNCGWQMVIDVEIARSFDFCPFCGRKIKEVR